MDIETSQPKPQRPRLLGWLIGGLAASILGAAAFWWWPVPKVPVADQAADPGDWQEPAAADPGYVGPEACAACHAKRVAEQRATSHFRACRVPHEGDMPRGFDPGQGVHRTLDPNLRFEMTHTGGHYFQTAVRTTPEGEVRSSREIGLVYGAAKADEVFFSWQDDRLSELATVWLHPQNRWANASYNTHGKGDFSREVTPRCLECHNTWIRHQPGTRNQYQREGAILGVTCERCHGPGREHSAFHREHPDSTDAHAIVRPALLSRERRLEVCTQCHSNTPKARGPAFSYRPGEPLETHLRTTPASYPENDHVANQIAYLGRSKCFLKSDTLTCTTCHDPHRPNAPLEVKASCLKCHKPADCHEQARLPAAVRPDCAGCHMPQRIWMNVHFHTSEERFVPPVQRHEHRIGIHRMAGEAVLLAHYRKHPDASNRQEIVRLETALSTHWLAETAVRRRDHRYLAAIGALREAFRATPTPAVREQLREAVAVQAGIDARLVEALHEIEERRFPRAIEALEKLLAVKPDHALAHAKLGTALAASGKRQRATEHLRAAVRYDPDDPSGHMMLGWLSYLDGNAAQAVEDYRRADEIEPFNSKTHYHWGLALMKLERWDEAAEQFERVVGIDPNHAGAFQGLSHAMRRQGRPGEALPFARRAARLTRSRNADVLLTLAEVQADAGHFADAETTLTHALEAAGEGNPRLVPHLRRRLGEIRERGKKGAK